MRVKAAEGSGWQINVTIGLIAAIVGMGITRKCMVSKRVCQSSIASCEYECMIVTGYPRSTNWHL